VPSYHGLYYPYLHFQDEGWIKAAALYWDGMSRIVPYGMRLNDSDEIKRFEQDGFVRSESPHKAASAIEQPFRELIRTRGDALRERFGLHSFSGRSVINSPAHSEDVWYISDTKMADNLITNNLLDDLVKFDLAIFRDRLVGVHRELARVYMTALAETMAPDIGARPLADNAFDHIAIAGVSMERLADVLLERPNLKLNQAKEIEERIATIAFRQVIPRDVARIPASDIIKFRKDYSEDGTQFHDEVAPVQSRPLRLNTRTPSPSRRQTNRNPSCLIS
jgi:uncharacterized protein DUF6236